MSEDSTTQGGGKAWSQPPAQMRAWRNGCCFLPGSPWQGKPAHTYSGVSPNGHHGKRKGCTGLQPGGPPPSQALGIGAAPFTMQRQSCPHKPRPASMDPVVQLQSRQLILCGSPCLQSLSGFMPAAGLERGTPCLMLFHINFVMLIPAELQRKGDPS